MRRQNFVAALAIACAAVGALGLACESPSTAGPGGTPDASAARDARADGNGGGDHVARSCTMTPSGCLCSTASGPATACDLTSVVKNAGEQGVCCDSSFLCACNAFLCKNDPAQMYCACGQSAIVRGVLTAGTVVSECPAPAAGQKCCLANDGSRCDCLMAACETSSTMEVPNCSLVAVATCGPVDAGMAAASTCN